MNLCSKEKGPNVHVSESSYYVEVSLFLFATSPHTTHSLFISNSIYYYVGLIKRKKCWLP